MGFFSGTTKIVVGSSAMHLMDASQSQGQVADGVIAAILESDVPHATHIDITGHTTKALLNGYSIKVRRAHDYAKSDYKLGLPSGATLGPLILTKPQLQPYIEGEVNAPNGLAIMDHAYTTYSAVAAVYEYLLQNRGYDRDTNRVTTLPPGVNYTQYWNENLDQYDTYVSVSHAVVLPDNITARITYNLYIERWVKKTYFTHDVDHHREYTTELDWVLDNQIIEDIPIPGATADTIYDTECIVAVYRKFDTDGVTLLPTEYVWHYILSSGVYPELSTTEDLTEDEYLPVIPIRRHNTDLSDPTTQDTEWNDPDDPTSLYSTSKILLDKLGLDLESVGKRLNENPDISDMDHAYVMFGVNIQTEYTPALYYLNDFFNQIYLIQSTNEGTFLDHLADPSLDDEPTNLYNFNRTAYGNYQRRQSPEDAFEEDGLILGLQHDFINSSVTNEVIGEIGHAEKSFGTYPVTIRTTRNSHEGEIETITYTKYRPKLILKAQITETQVRTVTVNNLKLFNWIYGRYHVETNLDDIQNDPDNNGLVVPVQYNLAMQYGDLNFKNILLMDSTLLIINAVDKIKLKWYETGFFSFVVMAITLVIVAYTGQAWLVELAAALEAGVMATILFLLPAILTSFAISAAANFIISEFGAELGVIAAIIATIAAIAISGGAGLLDKASNKMMMVASQLIQVSSALLSSANEFLVEEAQKVKNEYDVFMSEIDKLYEELESILDLLENKADIDPLTFTSPQRLRTIPNETPERFFTRTLGLPSNTMFTIHDEIPNFFDMRLRHTKDISPTLNAAANS